MTMTHHTIANNENGSVIVVTLIMLLLLTFLGLSATDTSIVEMQIASNERDAKVTFYSAESGLEHGKEFLQELFLLGNQANMATGNTPDWSFVLDGSQAGLSAATDGAGSDGEGDYEGGVVLINNQALGGNAGTYSVRVWNNPGDGGDFDTDGDNLIWVRADASGPRGASSSVQILLEGEMTSSAVSDYAAQEGGGSGKNYSASDLNAIDFSTATQQL
jgi:Tfp pilus assembly protein PilX